MNSPRDHVSALRWRASNGRVHASNVWHRAAGNHIHGARQQYRNWLNGRAIERGKAPLPDRATRAIGSRTPAYRDRINPATGRPRRDDAQLGRLHDQSLTRLRERTPRAAALNRDLINGAHRRAGPSRAPRQARVQGRRGRN